MLTFWPAFEIKYAFVIYFVVAGAGDVSLALSVYYFNILKGFCIGFFYFVPSSSSLEIACLCVSGCDSFSQSMSHHRKYGECQAVYNFPLWKHTAGSNQQQHQQYAGIHKRMLENDERWTIRIYAHHHTHILRHMLNMYGAVAVAVQESCAHILINSPYQIACHGWIFPLVGSNWIFIDFSIAKFGINFDH